VVFENLRLTKKIQESLASQRVLVLIGDVFLVFELPLRSLPAFCLDIAGERWRFQLTEPQRSAKGGHISIKTPPVIGIRNTAF